MSSSTPRSDLTSSITKLSIQTTRPLKTPVTKKKNPKPPIADSWEDEDLSSSSDAGEIEPATPSTMPAPPPPTPISPTLNTPGHLGSWSESTPTSPTGTGLQDPATKKRPEKTDAVARRMIAGALGMKAPKLTDEQKAYEKAMKEQEKVRREKVREEERKKKVEADRAKAAVWED